MSRPDIAIRTLTGEQDLRAWERALAIGFLREPAVYDEDVEMRLASIDLDRTRGAFDGDRCVGTFRTFAQELTVPGGAAVPADAVSNVTVSPTHRRRGLLSRMMAADLAEAKERGDAVATLIAAEYPIYGRYGFGPATWITEWEVDATRAQLDPRYAGPEDGGRVELVDGVDVRGFGPAFHDRFRALQHGAVSRPGHWWAAITGVSRFRTMGPWVEPFYAVYRNAAGGLEGLVAYRADDKWEAKLPHNTATVLGLQTTTPAAERALWRYLLSIDWITTVATGHRAPDDLLPLFLGDPRAARMTAYADFLWIRPLDVPRLLASRTYGTSGSLVLDLHDKAGLANGRFLLRADGGGALCEPTTRTADLSLDVADFGPLYLGDESAVRLTALGRIDEERPGAAAAADAMLRTPRRPWCPDVF